MVLVYLSQCRFFCIAWILLGSSSEWLSRLSLCSTLHQSVLYGVGSVKLSGDLYLSLSSFIQIRVVRENRLHGGAIFDRMLIHRIRFGLDRSF